MNKIDRSLLWDITKNCNLCCAHCYNSEKYRDGGFRLGKNLTLEEAKKVVDDLKENDFTHINFLGGEPLFYPGFIDLVKYAKNKNFVVTLSTNGTMLEGKNAKGLLEAGVDSISVSLDGISAESNDKIRGDGVFNKVVSNIKEIVKLKKEGSYKSKIIIGSVLTKHNLHEFHLFPKFASDLGVDGLIVQFLTLSGEAKKNAEEIGYSVDDALNAVEKFIIAGKEYKDIAVRVDSKPMLMDYLNKKYGAQIEITEFASTCKGSSFHFYLCADGTMHPCGPCDSPMAKKAVESGAFSPQEFDVRTNTINEIINSKYFVDFFKFVKNPKTYQGLKTCRNCSFREICNPCPLNHFDKSDRIEECEWVIPKMKALRGEFLEKQIAINPKTRWFSTDDGIIKIFDMERGNFITLNKTGGVIWKLVEQGVPMSDVISTVKKNFGKAVSEDMLDFSLDLAGKGYLIEKK